ncbi:MAG: 4-hydroxybenzoyl-CoA reductase subunit beta [Sphingomonadales bacterium]
MDVLPEFELIRPTSLNEVVAARRQHPGSRLLGGGTDLIVNIRRGIGEEPPALIDMNNVAELKTIAADAHSLTIGASVTIAEVARHPAIIEHYPAIAEAAAEIAGPTHRLMGTVGGNLCLDTRCIYYNQSDWWRSANNYCLKFRGAQCHVAPKSKVCFATFSGDLAPALMIYSAEVDLAGPDGVRTVPVADLYSGDGQNYLTLRDGEIVATVRLSSVAGLRTAYDKVRVRQSIDYPLAGVAVGVSRDGDVLTDLRIAITGTNPRPVLLAGTDALHGSGLNEALFEKVDELVRDQIMAMKTTFTPGHYRRRVAGVLARRLIEGLFAA